MQLRLSLERELAMGRRIHTRFVAGLGLILVLWSGNTGCITQRKSFSLDSNSRVPFLVLSWHRMTARLKTKSARLLTPRQRLEAGTIRLAKS